MKINIIAIGTRMPSWVTQGCQTYTERMPSDYHVQFNEIPALKRDKHSDLNALLLKESHALFSSCRSHQMTIALDRLGKEITTTQLSTYLSQWHDLSQDINILIGGPEGIHPHYLTQAQLTWSLSKLTLPHPMVRIVIAEQLYRAYSMIIGHPYHR